MSAPRLIKEKKVEEFQESIRNSKAVLLAEYKGLTVHEMEELRLKLREVGGRMKVIKNTLARTAFNSLEIYDLDPDLVNQVAFVFSVEDAVGGTKAAHKFGREHDKFVLKSGYFDGNRIDIDAIKELANLPGRKELQSRLVGTLMAPMSEFVSTLTASLSEFIATLEARAEKIG